MDMVEALILLCNISVIFCSVNIKYLGRNKERVHRSHVNGKSMSKKWIGILISD